ncbi:dipeptide/oligopeptide/nickel ABC transporter ATP-binding protein, partial [Streptomyces tricolor]
MSSTTPLLDVSGLTKHFPIKGGFPIKRTVGAVAGRHRQGASGRRAGGAGTG